MDEVAGGSVVWKLDGDLSGLTASLDTAKSEISSFSTLTQSAERDTTSSFGAIASSADASLVGAAGSANTASDSVTNLSSATKESAEESDSATTAIGNSFDSAARRIIAYGGLTTVIYKVSEAVTGSISSFADFDSDLGILQTVTGATSAQMTALSNTAIQLGDDISLPGVSASDAATAELELAKAGLSVNDVLGASRGVLSLATAGQIDVADAADITAEALNSFGLAGSQATSVADELAAGADASTASVSDMALGLEQVGAGAHQLGIPLSDTITALSLFSNAGIDGERAGTDLNQMFQQLAAPTTAASTLMKQLGLNFFNAKGDFVGLSAVASDLQQKFKGLTQEQQNNALAVIFGSSATRTAAVLANQGAAGFSAMADAVNKQGAAADLAAAANTGIKGSLSALQSNLQTTQLELGKFISAGLKPIIDLANSNMPAALTATGVALLGVAGVIAYIMNPALFTMAGALGAVEAILDALGIGLIIAGISALAVGIVVLQQKTDFLGKAFQDMEPLFHDISTALRDIGAALTGADPTVGAVGQHWIDFTRALVPLQSLMIDLRLGFGFIAQALIGADPTVGAVGAHWVEFTQALVPLQLISLKLQAGFSTLANGLKGLYDGIVGNVQVVGGFTGGMQDLGIAIDDVYRFVAPIVDIIGRQLFKAFGDVAKSISSALIPAFHTIMTALTPIRPYLKDIAIALTVIVAAPIVIAFAVLTVTLLALAKAIQFIAPLFGDLVQWTADVIAAFISFTTDIITSIVELGADIVKAGIAVIDWFGNLLATILFAIGQSDAWLYDTGKKIVDGLIGGIVAAAGGIYTAVKDASDQIGAFFAGAANWLYDVGRAVVQGLIDGMESMVKDVGKAAGDIGSAVEDKVKSLLGIHSPSTVFHDIGMNVGLGFVNGIASMQSAAASAMGDLTSHAGSLNLNANLNTSAGASIASGLDNRPASIPQSAGTNVTVHLNQSGIVATSRSAFRNIMKDGISAVNEELRARRLPLIADGKLSGSSTA